MPRQGLRPLAVWHRHQRETGLPRGGWKIATGRNLGAGKHHRQPLYGKISVARSGFRQSRASNHRHGFRQLGSDANPRRKRPVLLGHSFVNSSYDIIIVGAGIVGAACAMECSRGGLRTLVLDRGPIAGGTTAAGMGHLVVMDDSEAQFSLTSYSRRLWHEIRPRLSREVEFDACGTLWVAADDEEMAEVRRKQKFYEERGVRVEVLDDKGVAQAEPNLRRGMAGGLRVPDDAVIYPPCAAEFLLEEAKKAGAEVRTRAAVKALLPEGGVELEDGSRISAERSVSATGPWSPDLTPGLAVRK